MGPGEMRSSNIGLWQCEQQRRSVAVKDCGDEGTASPVLGGSISDLPVADKRLFGTATEPILPNTPVRG